MRPFGFINLKRAARDLRRFLSVSMAGVLLFAGAADGWAQSNFWSDRRQASARLLPSALPGAESDAAAQLASIPSPSLKHLLVPSQRAQADSISNPAFQKFIPSLLPYGTIQSLDQAKNKTAPLVILLQDAHGQIEAQRNLANMVLRVLEQSPNAVVGLEGGWGRLDTASLRDASPVVNQEVGSFLFNAGMISGPERAVFDAPGAPQAVGVEDPDLYRRNVEAVQSAMQVRPALTQALKAWSDQLAGEKKRVYSSALLDLDRSAQSYADGRLSLIAYFKKLQEKASALGMGEYPQLKKLDEALALEASLDFNAAETERNQALSRLAGKLSRARLAALVQTSVSFRQGRLGYGDFYESLRAMSREAGLSLSGYPQFESYLRYVSLSDAIRPQKLFQEMAAYESQVWLGLAATASQKDLHRLSADLRLLEKLAQLSLTPEEWARFVSRKPEFLQFADRLKDSIAVSLATASFRQSVEPCIRFYEAAESRNKALVDNLLAQSSITQASSRPSMLVAGGFHAPGLTRLLRQSGAHVLVVSPKMNKVDEAAAGGYLAAFTRDKTPLEQIFAAPTISLAEEIGLQRPSVLGIIPALRQMERAIHIEGQKKASAPAGRPGLTVNAAVNGEPASQGQRLVAARTDQHSVAIDLKSSRLGGLFKQAVGWAPGAWVFAWTFFKRGLEILVPGFTTVSAAERAMRAARRGPAMRLDHDGLSEDEERVVDEAIRSYYTGGARWIDVDFANPESIPDALSTLARALDPEGAFAKNKVVLRLYQGLNVEYVRTARRLKLSYPADLIAHPSRSYPGILHMDLSYAQHLAFHASAHPLYQAFAAGFSRHEAEHVRLAYLASRATDPVELRNLRELINDEHAVAALQAKPQAPPALHWWVQEQNQLAELLVNGEPETVAAVPTGIERLTDGVNHLLTLVAEYMRTGNQRNDRLLEALEILIDRLKPEGEPHAAPGVEPVLYSQEEENDPLAEEHGPDWAHTVRFLEKGFGIPLMAAIDMVNPDWPLSSTIEHERFEPVTKVLREQGFDAEEIRVMVSSPRSFEAIFFPDYPVSVTVASVDPVARLKAVLNLIDQIQPGRRPSPLEVAMAAQSDLTWLEYVLRFLRFHHPEVNLRSASQLLLLYSRSVGVYMTETRRGMPKLDPRREGLSQQEVRVIELLEAALLDFDFGPWEPDTGTSVAEEPSLGLVRVIQPRPRDPRAALLFSLGLDPVDIVRRLPAIRFVDPVVMLLLIDDLQRRGYKDARLTAVLSALPILLVMPYEVVYRLVAYKPAVLRPGEILTPAIEPPGEPQGDKDGEKETQPQTVREILAAEGLTEEDLVLVFKSSFAKGMTPLKARQIIDVLHDEKFTQAKLRRVLTEATRVFQGGPAKLKFTLDFIRRWNGKEEDLPADLRGLYRIGSDALTTFENIVLQLAEDAGQKIEMGPRDWYLFFGAVDGEKPLAPLFRDLVFEPGRTEPTDRQAEILAELRERISRLKSWPNPDVKGLALDPAVRAELGDLGLDPDALLQRESALAAVAVETLRENLMLLRTHLADKAAEAAWAEQLARTVSEGQDTAEVEAQWSALAARDEERVREMVSTSPALLVMEPGELLRLLDLLTESRVEDMAEDMVWILSNQGVLPSVLLWLAKIFPSQKIPLSALASLIDELDARFEDDYETAQEAWTHLGEAAFLATLDEMRYELAWGAISKTESMEDILLAAGLNDEQVGSIFQYAYVRTLTEKTAAETARNVLHTLDQEGVKGPLVHRVLLEAPRVFQCGSRKLSQTLKLMARWKGKEEDLPADLRSLLTVGHDTLVTFEKIVKDLAADAGQEIEMGPRGWFSLFKTIDEQKDQKRLSPLFAEIALKEGQTELTETQQRVFIALRARLCVALGWPNPDVEKTPPPPPLPALVLDAAVREALSALGVDPDALLAREPGLATVNMDTLAANLALLRDRLADKAAMAAWEASLADAVSQGQDLDVFILKQWDVLDKSDKQRIQDVVSALPSLLVMDSDALEKFFDVVKESRGDGPYGLEDITWILGNQNTIQLVLGWMREAAPAFPLPFDELFHLVAALNARLMAAGLGAAEQTWGQFGGDILITTLESMSPVASLITRLGAESAERLAVREMLVDEGLTHDEIDALFNSSFRDDFTRHRVRPVIEALHEEGITGPKLRMIATKVPRVFQGGAVKLKGTLAFISRWQGKDEDLATELAGLLRIGQDVLNGFEALVVRLADDAGQEIKLSPRQWYSLIRAVDKEIRLTAFFEDMEIKEGQADLTESQQAKLSALRALLCEKLEWPNPDVAPKKAPQKAGGYAAQVRAYLAGLGIGVDIDSVFRRDAIIGQYSVEENLQPNVEKMSKSVSDDELARMIEALPKFFRSPPGRVDRIIAMIEAIRGDGKYPVPDISRIYMLNPDVLEIIIEEAQKRKDTISLSTAWISTFFRDRLDIYCSDPANYGKTASKMMTEAALRDRRMPVASGAMTHLEQAKLNVRAAVIHLLGPAAADTTEADAQKESSELLAIDVDYLLEAIEDYPSIEALLSALEGDANADRAAVQRHIGDLMNLDVALKILEAYGEDEVIDSIAGLMGTDPNAAQQTMRQFVSRPLVENLLNSPKMLNIPQIVASMMNQPRTRVAQQLLNLIDPSWLQGMINDADDAPGLLAKLHGLTGMSETAIIQYFARNNEFETTAFHGQEDHERFSTAFEAVKEGKVDFFPQDPLAPFLESVLKTFGLNLGPREFAVLRWVFTRHTRHLTPLIFTSADLNDSIRREQIPLSTLALLDSWKKKGLVITPSGGTGQRARRRSDPTYTLTEISLDVFSLYALEEPEEAINLFGEDATYLQSRGRKKGLEARPRDGRLDLRHVAWARDTYLGAGLLGLLSFALNFFWSGSQGMPVVIIAEAAVAVWFLAFGLLYARQAAGLDRLYSLMSGVDLAAPQHASLLQTGRAYLFGGLLSQPGAESLKSLTVVHEPGPMAFRALNAHDAQVNAFLAALAGADTVERFHALIGKAAFPSQAGYVAWRQNVLAGALRHEAARIQLMAREGRALPQSLFLYIVKKPWNEIKTMVRGESQPDLVRLTRNQDFVGSQVARLRASLGDTEQGRRVQGILLGLEAGLTHQGLPEALTQGPANSTDPALSTAHWSRAGPSRTLLARIAWTMVRLEQPEADAARLLNDLSYHSGIAGFSPVQSQALAAAVGDTVRVQADTALASQNGSLKREQILSGAAPRKIWPSIASRLTNLAPSQSAAAYDVDQLIANADLRRNFLWVLQGRDHSVKGRVGLVVRLAGQTDDRQAHDHSRQAVDRLTKELPIQFKSRVESLPIVIERGGLLSPARVVQGLRGAFPVRNLRLVLRLSSKDILDFDPTNPDERAFINDWIIETILLGGRVETLDVQGMALRLLNEALQAGRSA